MAVVAILLLLLLLSLLLQVLRNVDAQRLDIKLAVRAHRRRGELDLIEELGLFQEGLEEEPYICTWKPKRTTVGEKEKKAC